MTTKRQIADALKERLVDVAERGRVLGSALKVRADLASTRRQLRLTFEKFGEHVFNSVKAGELNVGDPRTDNALKSFMQRIEGDKAAVRMKEAELREIMQAGVRGNGEAANDDL